MKKDINFFAPYQGQKKEEKNKNIYVHSIVGFLTVAILGTLIWNTANLIFLKSEIDIYEKELNKPEIQDKLKEAKELTKKIGILKRYDDSLTEVITAVKSREVVSTKILNMLSSTLPSEVSFNSINLTNGEISIQAVSSSRTAIAELQYNLKKLDNVQDVYIGAISGETSYTFDVKCVLKDVE